MFQGKRQPISFQGLSDGDRNKKYLKLELDRSKVDNSSEAICFAYLYPVRIVMKKGTKSNIELSKASIICPCPYLENNISEEYKDSD